MNEQLIHRSLRGHEAVHAALNEPPGHVHMLGIGGVGMAGLALVLKKRGWQVSGCDAYDGPLLPWLRLQGIACETGHDPAHINDSITFMVRSPAVTMDEPELQQAVRCGIPCIERGKLLPALLDDYRLIAVGGTHGKTTTACMIAWILQHAGQPVSYCIGGVCPNLGAVAHVASGGHMVIEADESDGTLAYYRPVIAVITAMDVDHVDHYDSKDRHVEVFQQFISSAETIIIPRIDPDAVSLVKGRDGIVSVGFDSACHIQAQSVEMNGEGTSFILKAPDADELKIQLGITGSHNVMNALMAIAVSHSIGIDWEMIASALLEFRLPKRRFETVAEGRGIRVISDYAHHPVEIRAMLEQVFIQRPKRTIAVFQPHRFSRTKAFMKDFVDVLRRVDRLILLPVYSASEPYIVGGTSEDLARAFSAEGVEHVSLEASLETGWDTLKATWREGDMVLLIGAGDIGMIGSWAHEVLTDS